MVKEEYRPLIANTSRIISKCQAQALTQSSQEPDLTGTVIIPILQKRKQRPVLVKYQSEVAKDRTGKNGVKPGRQPGEGVIYSV